MTEVPDLLVSPPWENRTRRAKPVVLDLPRVARPTTLAWRPDEQFLWSLVPPGGSFSYGQLTEELARAVREQSHDQARLLALVPDNVALPVLRSTLVSQDAGRMAAPLRHLLGRYGDDALRYVAGSACLRPLSLSGVLLPVTGSEITPVLALALHRYKGARKPAHAWFRRHYPEAVPDLIPIAVGPVGKERDAAENALRVLAGWGHTDLVLTAASEHGSLAAQAIQLALDADPLQDLPSRMPALPEWLNVEALPPVTRNGQPLPQEAVSNLLLMLLMCKPRLTYAGVEIVRAQLDAPSLGSFAWAILDQWRTRWRPSESWIVEALGLLGDDQVARQLVSTKGLFLNRLEVLSAIGTEVALQHLHALSQKGGTRAFRAEAQAAKEELAETLDLTPDQLEDRLVPDLGLDAIGEAFLDYGPRQFRIGFDEHLRVVVSDPDGSRRKSLPRPSAKDDPVLATPAYERFVQLKKDVALIADQQLDRLERCVVNGRRWTVDEHRRLFVVHPLIRHVARRLVWIDGAGDTFRIAEDDTFSDSRDEHVALMSDTELGIAHPLLLDGDEVTAWGSLFADYEILQPFPQLGRGVHRLEPVETDVSTLTRWARLVVPTSGFNPLLRHGWVRTDFGVMRDLGRSRRVAVSITPGLIGASALGWHEQTIGEVVLHLGHDRQAWGTLDPVLTSEVLGDLEGLRTATTA